MSATPWSGRRLHFIGVGGAGMSGLAIVARALGAEVSGSDRAESSYIRAPARGRHRARDRPRRREPARGRGGGRVTAIPEDNPELVARASAARRCCTAATCSAR